MARPAASAGSQTGRERLDRLLVARGLYATRAQAQDAIRRGVVRVGGEVADKTGALVEPAAEISLADGARRYVSRAALKLVAALDRFGLDPAGCTALDLGASTGGFTEVLLERGAARVYAIDVGHGQIAPKLAVDPRVSVLEGVNARDFDAGMFDRAPDFLTADLSFISLRIALPPALSLAAPGAAGVFLIKPQFEAGRAQVGKGGIVRDPAVVARVTVALAQWLDAVPGWRVLGTMASPIAGADGNREVLMAARRDRPARTG